MRILQSLLSIFGLLFTLNIFADDYKLDLSHTHLGFKVRHLGISYVRGQFNQFEGRANYNEKTNNLSNMKVTIDASSIDTNEADRDKHLRSKDFFEVEKYKTIVFESTEIKYKDKNPISINGNLTIHGITLPVTLKIEEWGGTVTDPWKNKRLAFEAKGEIDRRKFGLTWNKGLEKVAGLMVGNEVILQLEVEAIKME